MAELTNELNIITDPHDPVNNIRKHRSQDAYPPQLKRSPNLPKNQPPQYLKSQGNVSKNNKQPSPKVISTSAKIKPTTMNISPKKDEFTPPIQDNQIQKNKQHIKECSLEKIMSENESFQEISSDSDDSPIIDEAEIDEDSEFVTEGPTRRFSQYQKIQHNYNTSPNEKNNTHYSGNVHTIINQFPKLSSNPFITNEIPQTSIDISNTTGNAKKNSKDKSSRKNSPRTKELIGLYRDMLILARKGDRESFLDNLNQILNRGGDLNYSDERGFTGLHYACDEGNLKIVDILVKAHCDLQCKTTDKKTPLHLSAIHGYFDISKLLLQNGANLNACDNEKNTPLHFSVSNGHVELTKYFIEKMTNIDIPNIYGKTPLDEAKTDELRNIIIEQLTKKNRGCTTIKIQEVSESNYENLIGNVSNGNILSNSNGMVNNHIFHNINNNVSNESINTTVNASLNNTTNLKNSNSKRGLRGLSPINSNKYVSQLNTQANQSSKNKTDLQLVTTIVPSTTKNSTGKSKNFTINQRVLKKYNTNVTSSPAPISNKKDSYAAQNLLKKNCLNIGGANGNISNISLNTSTNKINKNFSKKNSMSSFKQNSNTLRNKKFPISNVTSTNTGFHKTKTLTKFLSHSNSNDTTQKSKKGNKNMSSHKIPPNNSNNNNSSSNNQPNGKANLSIETNERLNKTEDNEHRKNFQMNPNDSKAIDENLYNQINLNSIEEEERVTITSFSCLAVLGRGSFGEVFLVKKNDTNQNYAMKVLSKERIMGQNLLKYVIAERNVLSLTNHPFIVRLHYAFQTNHKLLLIMDYCERGDLSLHLRYEKRFTEDRARFYLCEVLLALEDLHRRNIIFRDLKPDNVVLDFDGHAKLTDFGLSKEGVFDAQGAKSFCGSIAYLAPEMLKKQGHGKAVDWYLLGVLFYEMLTGNPPYFTEQK